MSLLQPGKTSPFGANFDGNGVNFCVFSSAAEKIELCLFDDKGNERRMTLPARTGNLWHGYLPGARVGLRYGFRAHGEFAPSQGLRFNGHKLLIDPSARTLEGRLPDDPRLCGGVGSVDTRDSAAIVPKSRVTAEDFDWQDDAPPSIPWGETIIYEAHVRGLTLLHPGIPEPLRGTYAALGHPVMVNYLKNLGITALELLPVQHHVDEPRLQRLGLSNYWGYNVLGPCALEPSYASGEGGVSAQNEFKAAVKALHQAGIEVLLDVVFNHTAELDVEGPTVSMRGFDSRAWFWQNPDGSDNNLTGCGNAMRLVDDETIAWTIESLRYWVEAFHIDGFRFDLGTLLGRTPEFAADSPMFKAIKACPVLGKCKLIAEPWDIGPGGYQVGNFPAPFAEWSDRWRDDIRQFWLYGTLSIGDFARRFSASADLFNHDGRLPSAAVNMLTAHDGFTLRDLVSFNQKHNHANGENNRDGHDNNYSQNHGEEGLNVSESVMQQRKLSQRALLATLLLSQGTPMLLAGDEIGHSQRGNNNAYCQDNALTWLNWQQGDQDLHDYVSALIALRKKIPALMQDSWWQGASNEVRWLDGAGAPMTTESWEQSGQQCLQIRLSDRWLLVVNSSLNDVEMTLPEGVWTCVAPFDNEQQNVREGSSWRATAKTLCVLTQG